MDTYVMGCIVYWVCIAWAVWWFGRNLWRYAKKFLEKRTTKKVEP